MAYNPQPTRVWSRVQNSCTYENVSNTSNSTNYALSDYQRNMSNKGNVLQYKGNSARFTRSQLYAQLAKGTGPNRTKSFATQSQTYSNPNTTGLLRVNYTTYEYPNQIVGAPNNISGPFAYNVSNPNGCSGTSVMVGGNLICGSYANPCTNEITQSTLTSLLVCNPASASNVPGPEYLCWERGMQTWFPRNNLTMNNSGNKWPQNYKGFVSALNLTKCNLNR